MTELNTIETPKSAGFVDRGFNQSKKRAAMEAEEKEIAKLEAEQRGETLEETEEVEAVEETEEVEDNSKLSGEEKSFKKRYGDLRRHMADKEKDWNERFEKLEKSSSSTIPPKSDEDIEEWASEHPDIAGIVETIAAKKAQELFSKADSRLQKLDELQNEAVRKTAEATIVESHSDFVKIRESDEFHSWADEQPKWVKDALYENQDDAKSVARVIDLYKQDKNISKTTKSDKAAATSVNARTRTSPEADESRKYLSESVVHRMSPREYAKRSDEIMTAMREGKFTYDMSKKT